MKAIVACGLLALLGACEGRKSEPGGLGPWRFTQATRKDFTSGQCSPTEITDGRTANWCIAPPVTAGGKPAEMTLYFEGTEPSGRLIEIQLSVRGCVEDDLETWMRRQYGKPKASKGVRVFWENTFLWAVAVMPSEPGRCLVRILPRSETAEIARLEAEA